MLTAHLIHMYLNTEEKWKLIKDLIQSLLGQGQLFQHLCGALGQAQKEEQRLGMYLSSRIYLEMKENNKRTPEFSTKTVFSTVFLGSSRSLGYNHSVQPLNKIQQILLAWWAVLKQAVLCCAVWGRHWMRVGQLQTEMLKDCRRFHVYWKGRGRCVWQWQKRWFRVETSVFLSKFNDFQESIPGVDCRGFMWNTSSLLHTLTWWPGAGQEPATCYLSSVEMLLWRWQMRLRDWQWAEGMSQLCFKVGTCIDIFDVCSGAVKAKQGEDTPTVHTSEDEVETQQQLLLSFVVRGRCRGFPALASHVLLGITVLIKSYCHITALDLPCTSQTVGRMCNGREQN